MNPAATPSTQISCVIPVLNGERYIRAAIESVLQQSVSIAEVIVVDDGSTDATADVVASFGDAVRYLHQENAGVSAARNRGVAIATGDFICFLDADDRFDPEKTRVQLDHFAAVPELVFCDAHTQYFWSEEMSEAARAADSRFDHDFWHEQAPGHISTWLVRRAAFTEIGVFDETLRFSEDTDWLLRLKDAGAAVATLPQCLSYRRLHADNVTAGNRQEQVRGLAIVFKRSRARRAAAADSDPGGGAVMSEPTVSCIIPVYNGAAYLEDSIESVLRQTRRPRELIVVDDGSTDDTARVARSFGNLVRYEYQGRRGVSAARNRGVELAVGDLISFLDADDVFVPQKNDFQVRRFLTNPQLDLCAGYVENFWSDDFDPSAGGHEIARRVPWPRGLITWMIRRDLFDRIGGFDVNMRLSQDVDWHLRAEQGGAMIETLPLVLTRRRLHGANNTRHADEDCRAAVLDSLRRNVLAKRKPRRQS